MVVFDFYSLSFFISGVIAGLSALYGFRCAVAVRVPIIGVALSTSVWAFSSWYMCVTTDVHTARVIGYVLHASAIVIPGAFAYFICVLTKQIPQRIVHIQVIAVVALVFELLNFTPYFSNGVSSRGVVAFAPDVGVLYAHFVSYFAIVYTYTLYILVRAIRMAGARDVLRFKFVFWLSLLSFAGFLSSFLYAFNSAMPPIGVICTLFLPLISIYAVRRERLFDATTIASEFFILTLWIVFFIRLLLARSQTAFFIELGVLIASVGFGILFIRNVRRDVEHRARGERLTRYLSNANARLRDLDRQKTEFVSLASHQLRGPIAAIVGYTALVQEGSYGSVPEHLKEPLARVFESGKRISLMVDDFLNVARIEQGRMSYRFVTCDVSQLITQAIAEFIVIAQKKNIPINFLPPEEHPILIHVDKEKFAQVLQNLIDNAVKFTTEGTITIRTHINERRTKVLISIADTGIGIAPEEIHNLSHKFNRASNANSVSVYGSGLGLYISKEILKAHDGWIYITSAGLGKGSTFTIEMPLERGERIQ